MKILSGFIRADAGEIELDGTPLIAVVATRRHRRRHRHAPPGPAGVRAVHGARQLPAGEPGGARLDRNRGRAQLADGGRSATGSRSTPTPVARTLSVGERQQLEIARLLWLGARLLILDEPTTGISASQRDKLFAILRRLAADGLIVIFVSHKLEEIEQLCDRVTVMRAGKVVGREDMPVPAERLVELMFGKRRRPSPIGHRSQLGRRLLDLRDVDLRRPRRRCDDLTSTSPRARCSGSPASKAAVSGRSCAAAPGSSVPIVASSPSTVSTSPAPLRRASGRRRPPPASRTPGGRPRPRADDHRALRARQRRPLVLRRLAARPSDGRRRIASDSIKGTVESTAESLSGGNQQRLLLAMMPRARPPAADGAPDPRPRHRVGGVGVGAAAGAAHRRHRHRLRLGRPRRAAALQRPHRRVLRRPRPRRRRRQTATDRTRSVT